MRKQTLTDFLLRVVTWVEFTDFQHHFSLISLQLILTDYFLNKYSVSDINLCLLIKLWGFFVGYFHQTTRGSEEEEDGKMSAGTSEFFCLICLLVCSCTAQEKITAEPGQDVILPCKVPNKYNINDIPAVEWIRPVLDPDHVFLYRDERFDPDSQHPSYQNRVDLQDEEMKDGNFSLVLKNVTMNDTGIYVCRVSQKGETEPFSIIYLEVYDYSWIIGLAVGLPLGVLVCLLSAAAVFLNRQNRKKKKILERTMQRLELEESIAVEKVNERDHYIRLKNISTKVIKLEGWMLILQINNREPVIYTFKESDKLQAEDSFTVGRQVPSNPHPDGVRQWSEMNWSRGDKVQLDLISKERKIFRLQHL